VATLFAVGSLRIVCARLGVTEIGTYRDEVRVKPLVLDDSLTVDLAERVPEAKHHATTTTLNLRPGHVPSADLPSWVEERLLAAAGQHGAVARAGVDDRGNPGGLIDSPA
jgi:hypothetical protein